MPTAPVGRDVREVLGLDDVYLTLKLTPNRGDCLSMLGIARDVAAIAGAKLRRCRRPRRRRGDRRCARDPHLASRKACGAILRRA